MAGLEGYNAEVAAHVARASPNIRGMRAIVQECGLTDCKLVLSREDSDESFQRIRLFAGC